MPGQHTPEGVLLCVQHCANEHRGVGVPLVCIVEHGYEGVGLAAAKGGLDLDDRITALPFQAFLHHIQQVLQPLGHVRFFEEELGVLVLVRGPSLEHFPQVRGEHIHGQAALQDVIVWNGNGMKSRHDASPLIIFSTQVTISSARVTAC